MSETIDCFLIGHNEIPFSEYEKTLRLMGPHSGAYRYSNLDFIPYKNNFYAAPEIFNLFRDQSGKVTASSGPLSLSNAFSGGIAYLGTYLHRHGFSFDYVNSFRAEKEYLIDKLQSGRIHLIAILTTLYVSMQPILEIVSFVKKYNQTAKIVLGGPFIAGQIKLLEETTLQYSLKLMGADFYVDSSQGEATLVNLLHAVRKSLPFEEIKNLYYKSGNKYLRTPIEAEDNKLEENTVDWSLFQKRLGKLAGIRTSISCPFSCSYCEFPQFAGKYQTTSVSALERELDLIAQTGRVSSIGFIDDTFNVPPQRFKEILRLMIRKRYKFRWNCFFRSQFTDREMVELMKESGCEGVYLGIESASQQILDNMNKAVTVDQYQKGIELLREYDITTVASIIVGFPGETKETVYQTMQFIENWGPTFFRIHLWVCSLHTPIMKNRDKFQINGSLYDWSHTTMNSQTASERIEEIFLSVKNSIFIPQYNFDFAGVINLLHLGMSLDQVKHFLNCFNAGVKEKLANPQATSISQEVAEKLAQACSMDIAISD